MTSVHLPICVLDNLSIILIALSNPATKPPLYSNHQNHLMHSRADVPYGHDPGSCTFNKLHITRRYVTLEVLAGKVFSHPDGFQGQYSDDRGVIAGTHDSQH